ncbi:MULTISPECIES: hypothetical protein [Enterobacter]|uniref:hypothetical protein n=1 Tax=Enterobacter TaxID=547 RepID=UPI001F48EB8D|nr:hypothetical protein [Enterobacter quasiroggenkampii]
MIKSENTRLALEEAMSRILKGNPRRIAPSRKLSVRSVEIEAGLSNGSAYYYPEIIETISKHKRKTSKTVVTRSSVTEIAVWKEKVQEAERLKSKFRDECNELKLLNAQIASDQYQQMSTLREALQKIIELEKTIERLNEELIKTRRQNIARI